MLTHSLTHSLTQALLAPCGTYVFMCIDGKARKNPCDRRARLWFFRLLLGVGRRLAGYFPCCATCDGGGAGGAIVGMATGTGIADAGVSYASVEEVENSSHAAHGISNVYAAKKLGGRWRKKAAIHQRETQSPQEPSGGGPEALGQAKQSRVPPVNRIQGLTSTNELPKSPTPGATPRRRSSSGETMVVTDLETLTPRGYPAASVEANISPRRPSVSGRRSSRVAPAALAPRRGAPSIW